MTDEEIEQFIDNDEALYLWYLDSSLTMEQFINEYRQALLGYIEKLRKGARHAGPPK